MSFLNHHKKYYINLDRSPHRKAYMEKTFPENLFRIRAYDGNLLSTYNDYILPRHVNVSKYELGCTLSHMRAILTAYEQLQDDEDGAFIMEDDIQIKYSVLWEKKIDAILKNRPKDCDCLFLSCINDKEIKIMISMKHDYDRWNTNRWGTGCYYITRSGMEKIKQMYGRGKNTIDLSKFDSKRHKMVADGKILYGSLITYNYTKPTFNFQTAESTIHANHLLSLHGGAENAIFEYFNELINKML